MTETDPKVATDQPARRRRRVKVELGHASGLVQTKPRAGADGAEKLAVVAAEAETPKLAPDEAETPKRAAAEAETPTVAVGEAVTPKLAPGNVGFTPRRRRIRRRVTPRFHLSRKRQRILAAIVVAAVAAFAVAQFIGASVDNPESYVPGGAIH
jgi:hypothetical protein